MAVFSLKNSFCNKVEEKNGFIKADFSDSRKKADGSWESFQWLGCSVMGNAKSVEIKKGYKCNVEGIVYQEKYQDKWYTKVVIFGISVVGSEQETDAPKKSNKVKMADVNASLPVKEEEPNFDDENDDEEFERILEVNNITNSLLVYSKLAKIK